MGEERNKILKHQGKILRKGDNGTVQGLRGFLRSAGYRLVDKRRRRNEEGRERQTGEMREWEMGGRERARHSFPFSPWFSVRVAQEDKAKRSVHGTIHSVSLSFFSLSQDTAFLSV